MMSREKNDVRRRRFSEWMAVMTCVSIHSKDSAGPAKIHAQQPYKFENARIAKGLEAIRIRD